MENSCLGFLFSFILLLSLSASGHSLFDITTPEEARQTLLFYSDLSHWVADQNMKFSGMVQPGSILTSCNNPKAKQIWGAFDLCDGYIYTEIFLPGMPIEASIVMAADDNAWLEINSSAVNCFSQYSPTTCNVVTFLKIGFNKLRFKLKGDTLYSSLCYVMSVTVSLAF